MLKWRLTFKATPFLCWTVYRFFLETTLRWRFFHRRILWLCLFDRCKWYRVGINHWCVTLFHFPYFDCRVIGGVIRHWHQTLLRLWNRGNLTSNEQFLSWLFLLRSRHFVVSHGCFQVKSIVRVFLPARRFEFAWNSHRIRQPPRFRKWSRCWFRPATWLVGLGSLRCLLECSALTLFRRWAICLFNRFYVVLFLFLAWAPVWRIRNFRSLFLK